MAACDLAQQVYEPLKRIRSNNAGRQRENCVANITTCRAVRWTTDFKRRARVDRIRDRERARTILSRDGDFESESAPIDTSAALVFWNGPSKFLLCNVNRGLIALIQSTTG
jgi:hypothetical protein